MHEFIYMSARVSMHIHIMAYDSITLILKGEIIRDEYPKWVGQPCADKCLLDGGFCNNETRICECHEFTHYQESNHECRPS